MTELVFIHGWGFDARFWDPLAVLLKDYPQRRYDRGYFGSAKEEFEPGRSILIGHSLGFMYGLRQRQDWAGWISVNSFARFVSERDRPACVSGVVLRDMRARLSLDTAKTVEDFYKLIEWMPLDPIPQTPNAHRLLDGLDELRDSDITGILKSLAVPGLVLATRNDPLVPEAASKNLAHIAHQAQLHWHHKGGHLLPQTDPLWCAQKIKDYVATLAA